MSLPSNLRHVVVINDASVAKGGATGLALLSARLLATRGLKVTYISGDDGTDFPLADTAGVAHVALGGRHIAQAPKGAAAAVGLYNTEARARLSRWIVENDTADTVYHLHGWSKILSPAVFPALRPVSNRVVAHAHDFFLACPNGAFQDYQRDKLCHRVPLGPRCLTTHCDKTSYARKLWRSARSGLLTHLLGDFPPFARLLLIHENMKPFLEFAPALHGRAITLRNPVEALLSERAQAEINERFVFLGRVEAEKGVLDAAAAARRANVPLDVVGDGPALEDLKRGFPEVRCHGWQDRPGAAAVLRNARAVLMPTRYPEPFGLVAVEASWSGLPVIATQHAFIGQELAAAGLGIACETRDTSLFADALRSLADMPSETMRRLSERAFGRSLPLANTPAVWADKLVAHYEALLEGGRSGDAPMAAGPDQEPTCAVAARERTS